MSGSLREIKHSQCSSKQKSKQLKLDNVVGELIELELDR